MYLKRRVTKAPERDWRTGDDCPGWGELGMKGQGMASVTTHMMTTKKMRN